MTHVLDEPIEAAEEAICGTFIHRHAYDWREPGTPKKQKQEARNSLRSMVAVLRILRAEREGTRAEELRAEGRREERERVDVMLGAMLPDDDCSPQYADGYIEATEEARERIREGDHWRGGEG